MAKTALAFLDYADDFDVDGASSLHYRFVRSTRLIRRATADPSVLPQATDEMHKLNWALAAFANEFTDELVARASQLRRLKFATSSSTVQGLLVAGPERPARLAPEHPGMRRVASGQPDTSHDGSTRGLPTTTHDAHS
ncbi:hypothetical protein ET445_08230 [Agromyces protaetiae]|uniref:Uncharacterized protein n=1 Tax=Agromyces protaetiae TaxID=2509455 RepID=A0A4P6FEA3_9MICO|nr:hypothetical protein [Agromyces protaetiae]QAY73333.1 hypothetical protein ET445_08230 [Agromyces protaetiae]